MRTNVLALYRAVAALLPARARAFLGFNMAASAAISVLDAVSLGLLAAVTTPILTGGSAQLPLIGEISGAGLLVALGIVCLLIVVKSGLATMLLWTLTRRLASYERLISARLFRAYVHTPWADRLRRNSAEWVRTSDTSVALTIDSFLLPMTTSVAEAATFLVVIGVLFVADPVLAAATLVYLLAFGAGVFVVISRRSRVAGRVTQRHAVRNARLLTEMIAALKEITLRGQTTAVAEVVDENRSHAARARADSRFLALVSRYVMDFGLVGGVVVVGIVGYLSGGVVAAAGAIAMFGLAGFRMTPSLVRIQSNVATITSNRPHAEAVVAEIAATEARTERNADDTAELVPHPRSLRFESVGFRYATDADAAVADLRFELPFGSSLAVVGPSGAGKSTLIDLVLGLLRPSEGRIAIDDTDLRDVTHAWHARVGYVPQEVTLFDATVAQNVALSWTDDFDRDRVREALAAAQLLDAVESRPGGIEARIGERGLSLSGGQRQRLGIARALYARPLVLVLDEATSALDTATEAAVMEAIRALRGRVTTITVAHRLATIRDADQILYLEQGRVAAAGTFEELLGSIPDFAVQARLAGLA